MGGAWRIATRTPEQRINLFHSQNTRAQSKPMDATTQRLCDFTRNLCNEDLPATALAAAKARILSTLAVALAAYDMPPDAPQTLITIVDELDRQPTLTQLIEATRLRAPGAC